ncbi:CMP-binding protein [Streptomonospora alba]|uniref:Adenosylcobinamide-GDP ribazoletransferase n=2 Tax=Streptomonospora alba TaxID=183763 RepID=A0A0C2G082_9ACTN|nr:adenosylcobinamide-GDP ribazoletransferase [Streptomonospora alba]KIH96698.1 CMP-binding protein [Streptomonospora alba]
MAAGTLTAVPVAAPRVDRAVAGWAMVLAPLVGALLGAVAATVLAVAVLVGLPGLPAAVAAVGTLALLTRGLHLDGLADLADGLGSGRPAEEALEVMRRSDIGPFGVITLVLVLLGQTAALGAVADASPAAAAAALIVAAATGRLAITWACTPRVPSARPEGLGAFVSATVPSWAAGAATGAVLLVAAPAGAATGGVVFALACAVAVALGLSAAAALLARAVARTGGITGDTLGAVSETATTAALVVAAAAAA